MYMKSELAKVVDGDTVVTDRWPSSATSLSPPKPFPAFPIPKTPSFSSPSALLTHRPSSLSNSNVFTWDDALRISQPEALPDDPSDLSGYSDKVKFFNRGLEMQSEFRPFVIEDRIVGYIHNGFAENLRSYRDVFTFLPGQVTLHSSLSTAEDRTRAVGDVVKSLGEELIPGIRNELFPVTSAFGAPAYFSLERAAAPYFGIKAYGVQLNGYVKKDGNKFLWIAKRSQHKQTHPGMLDTIVAGGLTVQFL